MSVESATGIAKIALILLNAILCNNVLLVQFQGICPFLGVSRRVETATGMGLAVTSSWPWPPWSPGWCSG